jgi:hypothetical protein
MSVKSKVKSKVKSRVCAVAAALTIAGGLAMAGAVPANAETPQCGQACVDFFPLSNPQLILDDPGAANNSGAPIATSTASTANEGQDFQISSESPVSDYVQAGIVSAAVGDYYGGGNPGAPDDEAFELEFAPFGAPTGYCVGVPSTAVEGTVVSLQPCGVNDHTLWILDSAQTAGSYTPLITATDTNFSTPYVLTNPSAGVFVTTETLQENSSGQISGDQLWSTQVGQLAESPAVTTVTLPGATGGQPYSASLAATGGVAPYTWTVTAGSLPPGLTLNSSTGQISGTLQFVAGTYYARVTVTDSESPAQTATGVLSITVTPAPLVITTSSLPAATGGQAYSATVAATGGVTPYSWSVTAGVLPPGLTLNAATGVISGTPDVAGTYQFTVTVNDDESPPMTVSQAFSISVSGPVITAIKPDSGPTYGDTPVIITGTGLSCPAGQAGCKVTVTFGGKPGLVELARADEILVYSPAGSGTVTVTVTVGGVSSQATAVTTFTYKFVL